MKNIRNRFLIFIFIFQLLFSFLCTTSFAENTEKPEITTYSPHCILIEASTRKGYL